MGATSLAQAKQTFVIRVRRSIGVEAARGLARLRLANLTHVHTFRRGESACKLRQREKSYYYDAREAHYNRFGPMVRPQYARSHLSSLLIVSYIIQYFVLFLRLQK